MSAHPRQVGVGLLFGSLAMAGCQCYRSACPPPAETFAAYPPPPVVGYVPPHPLTPTAVAPAQPMPPGPPALGAPVESRVGSPPSESPSDSSWHAPADGQQRLKPIPQSPPEGVHLYAPETPAPSGAAGTSPSAAAPPGGTGAPPAAEKSAAPNAGSGTPSAGGSAAPPISNSQSLPVGIPQFAQVKDRVASGLKPLVDGGLDWLGAHGYRTVLHVRPPGQDDSADRQQVQKYGMTYMNLEVSPLTLTPVVVNLFNRTVTDPATYPLFVYDKDGTLAGALWYLYFRTEERLGDDVARAKAARLGFKEDGTAPAREMWLAVQKFLSNYPPKN